MKEPLHTTKRNPEELFVHLLHGQLCQFHLLLLQLQLLWLLHQELLFQAKD